MAPPIPDRWIPYKAFGKVIEGTRFICFKVPLRKAVQVGKSDIKEIWDINTLLAKIPKLGAVIDLTNTTRYYDPRELQMAGILHQKILMPGRVIPPEESVQLFMDTVDEFLGKDCVAVQAKRARLGVSTTDFLIGVHCTHGLNRTGYMVCRYMRDRLNIPAKTAIKRFEKARGYEIERENYIADLIGAKPPPADFGQGTKLKPTKDKCRESTEKDNDSLTRRSSSRNWRSKETSEDWRSQSRAKTTISSANSGSWRSEPLDNRSNVIRESRTQNSSNRRKRRNDSERSFDFSYDY